MCIVMFLCVWWNSGIDLVERKVAVMIRARVRVWVSVRVGVRMRCVFIGTHTKRGSICSG